MTKKNIIYLIITIIIVALAAGTYIFMKSKGAFKKSTVYSVKFENVTGLTPGADVRLRGVKIGTVHKIHVDPEKSEFVIAEMKVKNEYKIPKDAIMAMRAGGFMDGNFLAVEFDKHCSGADCANEGHRFETRTAGMMENLFGEDPAQSELGIGKDDVTEVMEVWKKKVISEESDHIIGTTLQNMNYISEKMTVLEKEMKSSTQKYTKDYEGIMGNLEGLTAIMKDDKINQITNDLDVISKKMESLDLKKPMDHADVTMAKVGTLQKEASAKMKNLDETMKAAKVIFADLDEMKEKMKSSEGSIQYLMDKNGMAADMNESLGNVNKLSEDYDRNKFYYYPFLSRRKFLRKNPDKR